MSDKVVVAILAKNEEKLIVETLEYIHNANKDLSIYVFDDLSRDDTIEMIKTSKLANLVEFRVHQKSFADKKNFIYNHLQTNTDYEWVINYDVDEQYDRSLLENVEKMTAGMNEEVKGIRLPRINLPFGNAYPDWQVRVLRLTDDVQWVGETHEVPHYREADGQSVSLHANYNYTIRNMPILHLARNRPDDPRPWW